MFTCRPEIHGTFGAVASTHWIASAVGMSILERGGNAFDAAVAAGFALQVVEPHLNGPAGDMPALVWDARRRSLEVICGQGPAPSRATIAHYRGLGLDLVPGTGLLATVIPGATDGWLLMLRDYGTLRLQEVIEPAIGYAMGGHPIVARAVETIATVADHFRAHWPTSAAIYLPGGAVPKPRQLFRNVALAECWQRMLNEAQAAGSGREAQIEAARRCWQDGFIAAAIDRFSSTRDVMDSSGRSHRGVLRGDDLAGWRATVEKPATIAYRDWTVAKCGFWNQGPVLLQQLQLLKGFNVAAMDPVGPDFVHAWVECAKLAYADREAWYGDPIFVDVPAATLLSDAYAAERRSLVGTAASAQLRPGSPDGLKPRLPRHFDGAQPVAHAVGAGEPTTRVFPDGRVAGDTCHVDVVDRWGNMVAAMPSGGWLESSPVIPELGFQLNSRAQMFWLEEGLPASLAPGKRPRSTLSPSMALRDGKAALAWGSPGGDQQDQWQALMFLRHVDHGLDLQESIELPALHCEHWPNSFWPRQAKPRRIVMERRFPAATIADLRRRGHDVEVGDDWSEGRLVACAQTETPGGRVIKAAANPRGMQGYAVGR
ncbi:MAG: gamma-glutamyltransferase family protein [Alphaproteobacteria bacterium]|nr:gamma-glutamyltransferase family protein [Alphaproteobacteria bacterium]